MTKLNLVAITIYSFDIDEKLESLAGEELSVEDKEHIKNVLELIVLN